MNDIYQTSIAVELVPSKKNSKNNSEVENNRGMNFTDNNFMQLDRCYLNKSELKSNPKEINLEMKSKLVKNGFKMN